MEKNRIRSVKTGKSMRMSYQRQKEVLEMPNLIEVQKDSYKWFLDEGLKEVFDDISPIADYGGKFSLEFIDFTYDAKDAKYTIAQCKERDVTYAAPLKVRVRLINKETEEINEHEIFMGDLPLMTETGTFVINGAERVIVSQLVRSPGIYYAIAHDKLGKRLFSSTVIPNRGAWLEYETDSNDVFYVRVDRTRKVPITVLIRALGIGTNAEIVELFGEEPKILASFTKDTSTNYQEGLLELYKKIRPGEPLAVESAESLIMAMFFDPRRYDLAKVGRYKFNKKLHFNKRIVGHKLGEAVVDPSTGEILAEEGTNVTIELADKIQNAAVPFVWIQGEERKIKVLSSMMVDITAHVDLDCDPKELGVTELVYYPVLEKILEENDNLEDIKAAIKRDIHDLIPKHITKEDILASINYNMHLEYGIGNDDDIDHLGNRRIRSVGELLQNQYRIGLSRLERVVRERMTTQDTESISPQSLINIKPVTAAVKEFFGSSQLSQFMDQNNPLGELTHKRRLSALGPGGLSRDRAGFEVRDVHYSHYGRMCPVETPEGPNIGLINSLASYARINEYGFIEAPYRKIDKTDPSNPIVTDDVVYMTADEEDNYHVAQANEPLDEEGHFLHKNVSGRFREETQEYEKRMFDYMDVSPKMVFSVATALIPFLQNDDANRALMGSNMQRQAVPLLTTEAPVVGTGMETKAAVDSGVCVLAKKSGTVLRSTSTDISIKNDDGTKDVLMYSMKQVSPEMVANIRNITGVKYCDASTENLYDGLLPIPGTVPVEEKFSHCVTGIGVWRSSEQNFFTSEKLTLIAGRHIAENDTHSAIISDVLAEKNQIKLGNTFTITGGSRKKISLEVIGLFHANVTEKLGDAVTSYDKIQNHIFTDVASAIEAENSVVVQGFDDVKVTVDDPENLKQIMEQVKHLPGYEENVYTIAADDEAYQSAAASLSSLDGLVKCLLIGIIAVSIIILALILTLWGKTRVHETGVFLSLGIKKGNILGQYIAEVLLIAVFAFAASGITSNMFAATVADTLLQQTVQSNSLQDNAEDDTTMKSIDMGPMLEDEKAVSPDIQISVGIEDMLLLYLIGFCIIVISVTISSVSIMRLKPKNILNSMS